MGKPAARIGDSTIHGGKIVMGKLNVLTGGRPQSRITDMHLCPMVAPGPCPHIGGPIIPPCAVNVLVGMLPAARISDKAICCCGIDTIVTGEYTVLIGTAGANVAQFCMSFIKFLQVMFQQLMGHSELRTTGLGEEVDSLVGYSPTLLAQLQRLHDAGYTIEWGTPGEGTYHSAADKRIVIDGNHRGDPAIDTVASLAHEAGHGIHQLDGEQQYVPFGSQTRQQYIDANVEQDLDDEGHAKFNEFVVSEEIKDSDGPAFPQWRRDGFEDEWSDYAAHRDQERAWDEMGDDFGTLHPSTDPTSTYNEYYSHSYETTWDSNHPAPAAGGLP